MAIQTGLARLAAEGSKLVPLKRVGLLVNATSVDSELPSLASRARPVWTVIL